MKSNKPDPFTKEVFQNIDLAAYYVGHFKIFRRYRMKSFNELGMVSVVDKTGKESFRNGREFMQETLDFFQGRDESYAYRVCAELKKLMDEYKERWPG